VSARDAYGYTDEQYAAADRELDRRKDERMEQDWERRRILLAAFLLWYRETEALAATHPRVWHRPPRELRERVSELVREVEPEPLQCPCKACVNARAGVRQ
jgi:hypothetical protein